jgi:hypothetical protein
MLQTTNKPPQERGVLTSLKEFDPEVPGWIFWPAISAVVLIIAQLALTMR